MSAAGDNLSTLSAVLLIVLAGAFVLDISFPRFPKGSSDQGIITESGMQPDFLMKIYPNQFLVRNGTRADAQIDFTILNGFVGNVTLSVTVSPIKRSAPIVLLTTSTMILNASLPALSLWDPMVVSTTDMTPSGLYNITVVGRSATMSHTASTEVGVTNAYVPANGAELVYEAHFATVAYVGGATVLDNAFENLGYVPVGITNLTVAVSFGTFHADQSCSATPPIPTFCIGYSSLFPYVSVSPFMETMSELTIQIPDDTRVGNYTITITVGWVLNPGKIFVQSAPDLVTHGYLMVYSSPPNSPPPPSPQTPAGLSIPSDSGIARIVLPLFGAVAVVAIVLVSLNRIAVREKDKEHTFGRLPIATPSCPGCGMQAAMGTRFCSRCGEQIP